MIRLNGDTGPVGMPRARPAALRDPIAGRLDLLHGCLAETPVVRLAEDDTDLFVKLEGNNRNGSAKDRSAYWILRRAVERGDIGDGSTVVESSSGNFAISLASFCRVLRVPFVPVVDPNINGPTEALLRLLCDRVEKVGEKDGAGGYLGTRLARVRQLCGELDSSYWTNQYANPDAALAHQQLTGEELCRSFARIDYLFVGVGTGATLAGLSNRLKLAFPAIRVVAVDAEGSVVFGGPPRPRHLPGLGSSIRPPMVGQAQVDDVVIVSERDAVLGCHELLRRHGLYAGGSTGSVYAAVRRYFGRHHGPRPTVVFVSADRGSPYAETVYNPAWVNNVLGLDTSAIAGGPGDRG